jgi:hypothetical protein
VFFVDAANLKSYPETGTTWTDLTGNYNATLVNGPTFTSSNKGSIIFDGSNDRADVAYNSFWNDNVFGNATNFTISCWVKNNVFFNWCCLIQKAPSGGSGFYSESEGAALWVNSTGFQAVFANGETGNPAGNGVILSYSSSNTTSWFNLAFTGDGTTLRFYANGAQVTTGLVSSRSRAVITSSQGPQLASRRAGGVMNGFMSSACFYTRGLSADEIRQNYDALKGRYQI